jgi:dephospho-CoA kinase
MKILGLTGGIGSGKSTVAAWFAQQGVPVLDADQMAREVLTPKAVLDLFGPNYLDGQSINRKKIGELIFSNPAERAKLEAFTHPLIAKKLQQELVKLEQAGHDLVVYEAALIFEKNIQNRFDSTILVIAPEPVRLDRILKRGDLTREDAIKRMQAQMPDAEKAQLATMVIDNSGSLKDLAQLLSNRAIGETL